MTLRTRLLCGLLLVLAALAASGVTVRLVQQEFLTDQLDHQLEELAPRAAVLINRLSESADTPPGPPSGADVYVGRIAADGRLETLQPAANDPELLPDINGVGDLNTARTLATSAGASAQVRVLTVALPDGSRALFAVSTTRADTAAQQLTTALLAAAVAIMAVVTLVAWWVIRLGLRPIRQMTEAADAIAAGAIDRRVEVSPGRTEASRLGQALNTMIETNQESEARLRRFVADASHELRTPLTTLRGYSALHAAGGLTSPAEVDDAMRRMNDEATRMARLVDDLLQLTEIDEHRAGADEQVDLCALMVDIAGDLRVVQPDREVHVDVDGSLNVAGDRDQLTQAVVALTSNALRHTPVSAEIRLVARVGDDGSTALVEVVDRGPGIATGDLARVFDRFYRADAGRSRQSGGSGLGLAIVASIVSAHGGRYGARSEPGSGSTFWIELPLR